MSDYEPVRPVVGEVTGADLRAALRAGWEDFRHEPIIGAWVSLIFVVAGWFMALEIWTSGQHWWVFALALGFPLVGPFAAVAYYDISRRREMGMPMSVGGILSVVLKQRHRQVPSMAMVMILIFMFWAFAAHLIFGLFLGLSAMTNITSSLAVLGTANGLTMLAVGSLVGAGLSLVIFNNTVIGLPMVVDHEIDLVTAMIASWQTVLQNPGPMLAWAVLVAVLLLVAMIPGFLGLFVVLPWLGHATWHLYRRAIRFDAPASEAPA